MIKSSDERINDLEDEIRKLREGSNHNLRETLTRIRHLTERTDKIEAKIKDDALYPYGLTNPQRKP